MHRTISHGITLIHFTHHINLHSLQKIFSFRLYYNTHNLKKLNWLILQINFKDVELVYGPLGLEISVFLADILEKYHHQLKLEHNIRYITSDCAKAFGNSRQCIKFNN